MIAVPGDTIKLSFHDFYEDDNKFVRQYDYLLFDYTFVSHDNKVQVIERLIQLFKEHKPIPGGENVLEFKYDQEKDVFLAITLRPYYKSVEDSRRESQWVFFQALSFKGSLVRKLGWK